jgi:hypothetical protein
LTRSNPRSGQKYHMTPASFVAGAPPGNVGHKKKMERPRPSPAGPQKNPCTRSSAHANCPRFTRSRWTAECKATTSWWPCD